MSNNQIAFWGTTPPPMGGMSVHIQRLTLKMDLEKIDYILYNFTNFEKVGKQHVNIKSPMIWFIGLFFKQTPKVHYVITTRTIIRVLAVLFGLLKRKIVIIRVGGKSFENAYNSNLLNKVFSVFVIKYCSVFIGVNSDIVELAQRHKTKNVLLIPGFIPPVDIQTELPSDIFSFFGNDSIKIVVSGKISPKATFDIYGLWEVIELAKEIKQKKIPVKIVMFIYGSSREEIEEYKDSLNENGLNDIIYVNLKKLELWPTIKEVDLYLRPSRTDGDCNSLREALFFDRYAIATDIVPRPMGTILYKQNDIKYVISKIEELVPAIRKGEYPTNNIKDNSLVLIKLFHTLLKD